MTQEEFLRHAMIIGDYLDETVGMNDPITLSMYNLMITVVSEGVQLGKKVVIPEAPADEG